MVVALLGDCLGKEKSPSKKLKKQRFSSSFGLGFRLVVALVMQNKNHQKKMIFSSAPAGIRITGVRQKHDL